MTAVLLNEEQAEEKPAKSARAKESPAGDAREAKAPAAESRAAKAPAEGARATKVPAEGSQAAEGSADSAQAEEAPADSAQAAEGSTKSGRATRHPTGSAVEACPCGCNRDESAALFDTMPDEELLYDLADLFKVFADTTRIKILYALMGTDLCVADLAELIGATQSAVSHQLRTLKQARLVKFQRDGKNVIYSLSDDHVYTVLAQGMTHICE